VTDPTSIAALSRLDVLIQEALPKLARANEATPLLTSTTPPITESEAAGFFRAIDAGLFELTGEGYCIPRTLRLSAGWTYPLLERRDSKVNQVSIWREWLTHAATAAVMHLDYGYSADDIGLDVDAFDLMVYTPINQPFIAVEVKKTTKELERLIVEMLALQEKPFALRRTPRLTNSEQKYRGLLALRPPYFLASAPELTRAFAVAYPTDSAYRVARLTEVERVPAADE
jgi:hypothetical protein